MSKHLACLSETRYGPCGYVVSGKGAEQAIETMTRAHKSNDGLGLIGYIGFDNFQEAVDYAATWERTAAIRSD